MTPRRAPAPPPASTAPAPPPVSRTAVPAAGAVPWRLHDGVLQVALVHRPRYDDWSWPKGKLDPGEDWPVAAVREVAEETGLLVRLGRPLPGSAYTAVRSRRWTSKEVRYWAGEVVGGHGRLEHEIDEVAWLGVRAAWQRLSYARDREQLRALVRAEREGGLGTWPLLLVRHARSVARGRWTGEDRLRPLTGPGGRRAEGLVPLLRAYGVGCVVSSPSLRCTQTVAPFAEATGARVHVDEGLSEEGYEAAPAEAPDRLARLLAQGEPAALCSHGPVLPELLRALAALAGEDAAAVLRAVAGHGVKADMGKGEVVVAHLIGTGPAARVVSVERHAP